MAESTLTLGLEDYRTPVTEYVYGGAGTYANLSSDEQGVVDRIIDEAYRGVLDPPPIEGRVHEWSFLYIETTLSLNAAFTDGTVEVVSGVVTLTGGTWPAAATDYRFRVEGADYTIASRDSGTQLTLDDTSLNVDAGTTYTLHQDDYDLPEDFGRMYGNRVYFAQADNAWYECRYTSWDRIKELRQRNYQQNYSSGDPQLFTVLPVVNDPTLGTRKQIMFWPNVNAAATVHYRYRVRPDAMTTTNKFAYGASDHSRLLLAACMMEAELVVDLEEGVYHRKFMRALASSVAADSRSNRGKHLGYNGDWSDDLQDFSRKRLYTNSTGVTYKGGS